MKVKACSTEKADRILRRMQTYRNSVCDVVNASITSLNDANLKAARQMSIFEQEMNKKKFVNCTPSDGNCLCLGTK